MPIFAYIADPSGEQLYVTAFNEARADAIVGSANYDTVIGFTDVGQDEGQQIVFAYPQSTGLLTGGIITPGTSADEVSVSAGIGVIMDFSDRADPVLKAIEFGPFIDVPITDILIRNVTKLLIDENALLVQDAPDNNAASNRNLIQIGAVAHPSGTVDGEFALSLTSLEPYQQFIDLLQCLSTTRCNGLVLTPNADLTFDKSAGELMFPGAGNATGDIRENVSNIIAESPATFSYRLGIQDVITATAQTLIDPDNFDDGSGTPTAIGGGINNSTIQYIFQAPLPQIGAIVMYGQTIYSSLDEAVLNAGNDVVTVPSIIANTANLLGRLAIERGATDLSDPVQAVFLPGAKFGIDITGGSGGGGAGGGDVLGPASSLDMEIAVYSGVSGKILNNTADITANSGDLQASTNNGDLRLILNGTGSVQFGNGNILSNVGVANLLGGTVFSVATPLAGNALTQYEHNGVAIGNIGFINFLDNLRFANISDSKGIHIESDGQVSLGEQAVEPDFSVIVNGDEKPFGLPNLTTANEGALTGRQRMIHYNSVLDRVRYFDGTEFQSISNLNDTEFLDNEFKILKASSQTTRAEFVISQNQTPGSINSYGLPAFAGELAIDRDQRTITADRVLSDADVERNSIIFVNNGFGTINLTFPDTNYDLTKHITVVILGQGTVNIIPAGATTFNGSGSTVSFATEEFRILDFYHEGETSKTWFFDNPIKNQTFAFVKFNPNKLVNGEVSYRNAGVGFRVFRTTTGTFSIENDGTVLNELSSNWATRAASGTQSFIQVEFFIAGIAGVTATIENWGSANGPNTGQPGTATVFVRNASGALTDVTNANGHVYIRYTEI